MFASFAWCGNKGEPPPPLPPPPSLDAEDHVAALDGFEKLLSSLEGLGHDVATGCRRLRAAQPQLLGGLDAAFPEASSGSSLVRKVSTRITACAERFERGLGHVEVVLKMVEEARSMDAAAREALAAREAAWAPKARADHDAEALRKRFSRSYSRDEKIQRLSAKHKADEEFKRCSAMVSEALERFLESKWVTTAAILAEFCSCVAAIFGNTQQMAEDFGRLASELKAAAASPRAASEEAGRLEPGAGPGPLRLLHERTPEALPAAPSSLPTASHVAPQVPADQSTATSRSAAPSSAAAPSSWRLGVDEAASSRTSTGQPTAIRAGTIPWEERQAREAAGEVPLVPPVHLGLVDFRSGESIEIYSSSESTWVVGIVEKVFLEASVDDGYRVPAGTVKVSHARGIKYIRKEALQANLRRPRSPGRAPAA